MKSNRLMGTSGRLFFLVIAGLIAVTTVQAERVLIPSGVFYYQPAASVFGPEAAWVNPAGLGRFSAFGFRLMFDYADDNFAKSWGSVFARRSLAVAYRNLDNDGSTAFKELVVATGIPVGGPFFLGGSYRHFKEGPGIYHKRHFWNVGFVEQGGGPFTWGAVFSNLNRGRLDGNQTETEMRFSTSYRPLGKKLTGSIDMFLSTGTKMSNADYVYHLEVVPRDGLFINGYVTSDKEFEIGIRANLLRYITGARVGFESSGKHRRSTVFLGGTDMRQPSFIPEPKRRLAIGLSGNARENPPQPRWGRKPTPFATLVLNIYRAADDPSIGEMAVYLKDARLGFAQTQELREAITYFRNLGKHVYCHLARPGNLGYYLASAADKILIPPVSQLNLIGLRAELSFYAGTMEKLGVRADVMRIGEHKTTAEMLTRRTASEENRAQINRLLDSLYDQFVAAIASGRGVSTDSVRRVIDGGPYTSVEALQLGLVDGLSYRDDMNDDFLEAMPEVSFRRYLADTLVNDNWPATPVIAMVVADGEITTDDFAGMPFNRSQQVTPAPLKKAFRRAMNDRDVKGIVLRVNSPGGLALAADEILHAADKASEKRPLVASMGNVAASGGYQVLMAADQLFASPVTITGSIGIFGGKVDLSELYRKIDLGKELYTRGKFAGMMTTTRPFSEEQREKYFDQLKAFYDHFVGLVAENRALSFDSVDVMARGKVWTGNEALANGLIDRQGGIKQSLDYLADRLGLDDYVVEIFPRKRPLFILPGQSYLAGLVSLFSGDRNPVETVAGAVGFPEDESMFARMPFDIAIE